MHKAPKVQEKSEVERICYYWLLKGYTFEILWSLTVSSLASKSDADVNLLQLSSFGMQMELMCARGNNYVGPWLQFFRRHCLYSLVLTAPSVARRALLGFAQ